MGAWGLTGIAKAEDAGDLCQSEAGRLGGPDELQSADCGVVVASVAVGFTVGRGQQTLAFVEPDGLTVHAGDSGDFPNEHGSTLPLDLVSRCKVYGRTYGDHVAIL